MEDNKKVEAEVLTEQPTDEAEAEKKENQEEIPEWFKKLFTAKSIKELGEIYIQKQIETRKTSIWHHIYSFLCVFAIVGAVVFLSYHDKMTPAAGVIIGALAGYLFRRNTD